MVSDFGNGQAVGGVEGQTRKGFVSGAPVEDSAAGARAAVLKAASEINKNIFIGFIRIGRNYGDWCNLFNGQKPVW
jgi:hypothetical protein